MAHGTWPITHGPWPMASWLGVAQCHEGDLRFRQNEHLLNVSQPRHRLLHGILRLPDPLNDHVNVVVDVVRDRLDGPSADFFLTKISEHADGERRGALAEREGTLPPAQSRCRRSSAPFQCRPHQAITI